MIVPSDSTLVNFHSIETLVRLTQLCKQNNGCYDSVDDGGETKQSSAIVLSTRINDCLVASEFCRVCLKVCNDEEEISGDGNIQEKVDVEHVRVCLDEGLLANNGPGEPATEVNYAAARSKP